MLEMLAPAEVVIAFALVFVGVLIQGAIGLGFALVAVPTLLVLEPQAVPATPLLLALPMVLTMTVRERRAIDLQGFGLITAGRIPGTLAAVVLLELVASTAVAALVGGLVLVAVAASLLQPEFEVRGRHRVLAGFVSGVMSTAGGIGGPALALAYQRSPGPELRATLAVAFAVGLLMSLAALAAAGEMEAGHLTLAAALLPAVLLGLWVGPLVARSLHEHWLRPAVLAFAGAGGAAGIVQAIA